MAIKKRNSNLVFKQDQGSVDIRNIGRHAPFYFNHRNNDADFASPGFARDRCRYDQGF